MFINDMFNNKGINKHIKYVFIPTNRNRRYGLTNYERRNEKPFTNLSHGIVIDIKQKAELKKVKVLLYLKKLRKFIMHYMK